MKSFGARMTRKLRSSRGESIGEVLVATLISAVALVLLASMISSSTRIIERSENRLERYYAQNNALEAQSGEGDGSGYVTITSGTDSVILRPDDANRREAVRYFINDQATDRDVISYRYVPNT